MNPGDLVSTVFGIGKVEETSDTHAWIRLLDGTMVGAPKSQVSPLADG